MITLLITVDWMMCKTPLSMQFFGFDIVRFPSESLKSGLLLKAGKTGFLDIEYEFYSENLVFSISAEYRFGEEKG